MFRFFVNLGAFVIGVYVAVRVVSVAFVVLVYVVGGFHVR